jgi:RNA polymerase sigma-70 factor (ECF subfamily)
MDEQLVTAEDLYQRLFTPLFRYVYFRTRDRHLAEDLTQSVFLKFLKQPVRPETYAHSLKLLFTIARHTLIDHYRSQSRRSVDSIEDSAIDIPSSDPTPQDQYLRAQDVALVQRAIRELSEIEQHIVTTRMTTDARYDTIAEMVGISTEYARQIYTRALKKIKTFLVDNGYTI